MRGFSPPPTKRVEGELITDLKRVAGKPALLFKLATASLSKPDGAVRDVVFPAVGEQTLRDLVVEGENTGPIYRRHLQMVIHNSYRSHYRRMLPLVLEGIASAVMQTTLFLNRSGTLVSVVPVGSGSV